MKKLFALFLAITFLSFAGCAMAGPKTAEPVKPTAKVETKTPTENIQARIAEFNELIKITTGKVNALPLIKKRQEAIDKLVKKSPEIKKIEEEIMATPEWRQLKYLQDRKRDYENLLK